MNPPEINGEGPVWELYIKHAQSVENTRTKLWNEGLRTMVTFLALFSAVVTAFILQFSKDTLRTDYTKEGAVVGWELLRATALGRSLNYSYSIPEDIRVNPRTKLAVPSRMELAVNWLWFSSLAVSLVTLFATIVVQQYVHHFQEEVVGFWQGNLLPIEMARLHQARSLRMNGRTPPNTIHNRARYGEVRPFNISVTFVLDVLHVLFHTSLVLFMAGLVLFLFPLRRDIYYAVFGLIIASYVYFLIFQIVRAIKRLSAWVAERIRDILVY